jgi:hypothetical protein
VGADETVALSIRVPAVARDDPEQHRFRFVVAYTDGTCPERRGRLFERRWVGATIDVCRSEPITGTDA